MLWVVEFVIGSFVGSFLNVCIYRMPREQSIVAPRSRCPQCERPIAWYDNIPLISYLLLGGRCRHCRGPIHWRYPMVEALSGLAAVAILQRFGVNPVGIVYLIFVWALIVVSFIDLEHRIIPDEISIYGRWVGMAVSFLLPVLHATSSREMALGRSFIGAVVGGGVLYLTGVLGSLMFRKDAMGGGDVKLLAMAGSILGWKLVTLTFFLAPILAIVPGLGVLFLKRSHEIPYGPFLSAALVVSLFAGERLIQLSGVEESLRLLWLYSGAGT